MVAKTGIKSCKTRAKTPDKYRNIGLNAQQRSRDKRRDYIFNLKKNSDGCIFCGNKNPLCLDFDHIDPSTKDFTPATAIQGGYAWDRVLQEIDKCQLVCANCHRIKTIVEFGRFRNIDIASFIPESIRQSHSPIDKCEP